MHYPFKKLNTQHILELAKLCLDIGEAIFLGSVAAYFIPTLVDKKVSILTFFIGLLASLTSIIIGIILLKEKQK